METWTLTDAGPDARVPLPVNSVARVVGVEGQPDAAIGKGLDTQVLTNHSSVGSLLTKDRT